MGRTWTPLLHKVGKRLHYCQNVPGNNIFVYDIYAKSFSFEYHKRYSTHLLIQRSPVRFRAWSHTRVMDYDEACFMHLTPGVVHNFPKAVGV